MELNEDQIKTMKSQVIAHIESNFPDESKEDAIVKLNQMSNEDFIKFVQDNNLISNKSNNQCIFCSIVFGEIPSYKIGENSSSIAVLEINPVSKGHTIIIPKNHISTKDKIPKESYELAKNLSKTISIKLNPKTILVEESEMFGHWILNLIPVYNDENLKSKRFNADKSDLENLSKDLLYKEEIIEKKEEKPKEEIKNKPKIEENVWIPKRLP